MCNRIVLSPSHHSGSSKRLAATAVKPVACKSASGHSGHVHASVCTDNKRTRALGKKPSEKSAWGEVFYVVMIGRRCPPEIGEWMGAICATPCAPTHCQRRFACFVGHPPTQERLCCGFLVASRTVLAHSGELGCTSPLLPSCLAGKEHASLTWRSVACPTRMRWTPSTAAKTASC